MKTVPTTVSIIILVALSSFVRPVTDDQDSMVRGKEIYSAYCISCHMEQGEGIAGVYPPVSKSDYLMADKKRSVVQVIKGASGPMTVNGESYNGEMPGFDLTDQEVADLLTFLRNSFGNKGDAVKPSEVKELRKP